MSASLDVIYEDNHLLVVNKPAGLPTMGVADDARSLLSEARRYIKQKYHKPGNVYLGIVSRLDAPVTGVILLARTSKAAARLTEQFRSGAVDKRYWGLVQGDMQPPAGSLRDFVRKDERHRRMHVTGEQTPGAKEARLKYRALRAYGQNTLLEVELETGRKHQIRLQFGRRGHPILGDRKYGSTVGFPHGIALHSRSVALEHPVRHAPLELVAPLPLAWRQTGVGEGAGGDSGQ
jgi:23S rRNA pseudouridine1911/1915/1917 synthase